MIYDSRSLFSVSLINHGKMRKTASVHSLCKKLRIRWHFLTGLEACGHAEVEAEECQTA